MDATDSRHPTKEAMRRVAPEWLAVNDDVLLGLSHALNNRLAAIGSLARLLEYGDDTDALLGNLLAEITTLESSVELLGRLPGDPVESVEPIRLEDFAPGVLELHRLRRETGDLSYHFTSDPGLPPAIADPALLTRILLLVLGETASAARSAGRGRVTLHASVTGDDLILSIRAESGDGTRIAPSSRLVGAAASLLEAAGGRLTLRQENGEGGDGIDLTLPTRGTS